MTRPCPSCRHTADECSYPGEAKPGCLLDKRKRDELDVKNKGLTAKELRERIRERAVERGRRAVSRDGLAEWEM